MDSTAQTRSHMSFLLDSLQYYLMADVLDTRMSGLTARLDRSTSFEEVKLCHDQFLTEVQASIFLHNPQVMVRPEWSRMLSKLRTSQQDILLQL